MFDNLNWWEIGVLLLLALLIFGDKLPTVISDGLRMLRNLRDMARNATSDLSRELGADIDLEDLNPKTFIRKHVLSAADEQALRKPLQGAFESLKSDLQGVSAEIKDAAAAADPRQPAVRAKSVATPVNGSPGGQSDPAGPTSASFDIDAT
ncbi:MAG TPA: preprotein translocase subunit TatB [Micromonosporaceae bacterium]|jgi:sec-independent protein translocase protein TatB